MTAVIPYMLVLILPWVLTLAAYRLQDVRGLENLRLLLYSMAMVVFALGAFVMLTTSEVSVGWTSTETAPDVSMITGADGGTHRYAYTPANTTVSAELVLYAPAQGIGNARDAMTLGALYGGMAALFIILMASEIFRLVGRAWE